MTEVTQACDNSPQAAIMVLLRGRFVDEHLGRLRRAPRQIRLQRLLDLPTPNYRHLPVALNAPGEKLSKQTVAAPADVTRPVPLLCRVLHSLGQEISPELADGSIEDYWCWAVAHWDLARVLRVPVVLVANRP